MNRKTMRHKLLEVGRRVYFNYHGTYKGYGKIGRFYDETWRVNFGNLPAGTSYKDIWESSEMGMIRKAVNM